MNNDPSVFDIITFTAHAKSYYPASLKRESWMEDNWVPYTEIEIPPGHSRYGGPVMDLPPGVVPPADLNFAGQIDLSKFAPFDVTGLLPKTGHLFFFADIRNDTGQVIYSDCPTDSLVRTIKEHEADFFLGVLIDRIFSSSEYWGDRFRNTDNNPCDKQYLDEPGRCWDDSAGSDQSKIFGIFTHCQYSRQEIEEIVFSDRLVLLQVGENGFNDEGVFSVVITKSDLEKLNFNNCEFYWAQS